MIELLLPASGKKLPPKGLWEYVANIGGGSQLVRVNNLAYTGRLSSSSPAAVVYSLPDLKYVGGGNFTNNLGHYEERYLSSTNTTQPHIAKLWSAGGTVSGSPRANVYRPQIYGTPPSGIQTLTQSPNAMTPRVYPGCTGTNGRATNGGYIYGGLNGATVHSSMYTVSEAAGVVEMTYTGAPGPLQSVAMCHGADIGLWMFGGSSTGSNQQNKNDLWNMAEGTTEWKKVTPEGAVLPRVFNPGMVTHQGLIYIFGGITTTGSGSPFTYKYDPITNTVVDTGLAFPADFNTQNISHSFVFDGYIFSTNNQGRVIRMRL